MDPDTTPGGALVARIVAAMAAAGLQPDARERELLAVAETLADQLDGLKRDVEVNGYSTVLQSGRVVANPAVAAINQTATALARVLAQVSMTEEAPIDKARQRAAQARWRAKKNAVNERQ